MSPSNEASLLRGRTYTPGFSDELGNRLLAHGSRNDAVLEVLQFKQELSDSPDFERALRARIDSLRHVSLIALAAAHSVERPDGMGLCLVSEHFEGRRVSELAPTDLGTAFALDLIRTVTPVLEALNQAGVGVAHGALSADRIVLTTDGRLLVVEYVLGWALEALRFSRMRLNDLGIVVRDGFQSVRFDGRTDMTQLGFLALSVCLRRHLDPADCPAKVPELLGESADDGSPILTARMRVWLERAMQIGPRPFRSAQEAVDAFDELPDETDLSDKTDRHDNTAVREQTHRHDENDLSDETEPSLAGPADAMLEFPSEIPDAPARHAALPAARTPAVAPAPTPAPTPALPAARPAAAPPRETAALTVADLRASLERRQSTAAAPSAPGRRLSRIPEWIFAAVSLIALGEAVALMFLANDRRPADAVSVSSPAPQALVEGSALPRLAPIPTDPQSAIDSPGAGAAAPAPPADAPKPAPPTIDTSRAEAFRAAFPAAGEQAATSRFGGLRIASSIDLQVFSEGTLLGSTAGPIALRAGTHTINVVNETLEFRQTRVVNVRNGLMTSVRIAVPTGRISLNATPWAEVIIDGVVVGETPIGNHSLPIGVHHIVFRHPQLGERSQTVVLKAGTILRVAEPFER